jgi:uncharacterized membrane protein
LTGDLFTPTLGKSFSQADIKEAQMDIGAGYLAEMIIRWLHVVSAIIWVGLLYFFNLVNGPFNKTLTPETRQKVLPELMPRALFFFRWAAMSTFLLGLALLYLVYLKPGHARELNSPPGYWILTGMVFGALMWFNVWFIIWPCQRKIILGVKNGITVPPYLGPRAVKASRLNAFLSIPLVFCMLAGPHFPFFSPLLYVLFMTLGLAIAWCLLTLAERIKPKA